MVPHDQFFTTTVSTRYIHAVGGTTEPGEGKVPCLGDDGNFYYIPCQREPELSQLRYAEYKAALLTSLRKKPMKDDTKIFLRGLLFYFCILGLSLFLWIKILTAILD